VIEETVWPGDLPVAVLCGICTVLKLLVLWHVSNTGGREGQFRRAERYYRHSRPGTTNRPSINQSKASPFSVNRIHHCRR
jgi:hypothetical protein